MLRVIAVPVTTMDARLTAVGAPVTVQGEPNDAEVIIDGVSRGHAPQSFNLSAIEHRIEVRKEGWLPFTGTLTPAPGLDRTVHYHLRPADRSVALAETAATIYSQIGYALRLVPAGTFPMGSERREQGHRCSRDPARSPLPVARLVLRARQVSP